MSTRKRRGGTVSSRQAQKRTREAGSTPEIALEAEPIELVETAGDEIVDLTCESLEPVVVDLTHNDSVVRRLTVRNSRWGSNGKARSRRVALEGQESLWWFPGREFPEAQGRVLRAVSTLKIGSQPREKAAKEDCKEAAPGPHGQLCERRQPRRTARRLRQDHTDSCVVSSDDEELPRDRDVYVTTHAPRSARDDGATGLRPSGTVSCPICMDGYSEIVQNGRLIVSTECGHVFCSQCLRDSLKNANTCPTCRKKISHKRYHPIYI
ncbi:RING finger protein 4 [Heterocephalus glaber]|uniref:E3 ubiquitin-protein ligase RNF4 n=1 Tax=Heterocephalus glaber TaxID=10181 RepID=G5BCH6_HETGA|nr:RING finger protein 4 [Heterocephalus glaber]